MTYNFRDIIQEYYDIYLKHYENGKVYGRSSEDLLNILSPHIIKLNPKSILDYGCGRSSLINYFWNDGKRQLYKYDPAIREYRDLPKKPIDLVICTDVLEHIPIGYLQIIFAKIINISEKVIFGVSTIPARQKLSNGDNAHITILNFNQWVDRITGAGFPRTKVIRQNEKGFIVKTWN